MSVQDLKKRYRQFSIEVARLLSKLPTNRINDAYIRQLIRSSSSVGANYFAACRAKSKADFVNKMKIVEEELDESIFFLDLLLQFNEEFVDFIREAMKEGDELLRITVSSIKTSRSR